MTPDPKTPDPKTPDPKTPHIATGDRRAETRYAPDADQTVRVEHLAKPDAPLPRHEATTGAGLSPGKPGAPIEDVKVDTAEASVWDARPLGEQATQDVPRQAGPQASPEVVPPRGEGGGPAEPPFPPAELVSKRAGG